MQFLCSHILYSHDMSCCVYHHDVITTHTDVSMFCYVQVQYIMVEYSMCTFCSMRRGNLLIMKTWHALRHLSYTWTTVTGSQETAADLPIRPYLDFFLFFFKPHYWCHFICCFLCINLISKCLSGNLYFPLYSQGAKSSFVCVEFHTVLSIDHHQWISPVKHCF